MIELYGIYSAPPPISVMSDVVVVAFLYSVIFVLLSYVCYMQYVSMLSFVMC